MAVMGNSLQCVADHIIFGVDSSNTDIPTRLPPALRGDDDDDDDTDIFNAKRSVDKEDRNIARSR